VAITNRRLIALDEDQVRFYGKDYARGGVPKTMTLPALEFIRRFLSHVLPSGFVRIRHCGFLANRLCQEQLARCRALLGVVPTPEDVPSLNPAGADASAAERAPHALCPVCGEGRMMIIETLAPIPIGRRSVERFAECFVFDTS
jgi:hypothetical protein